MGWFDSWFNQKPAISPSRIKNPMYYADSDIKVMDNFIRQYDRESYSGINDLQRLNLFSSGIPASSVDRYIEARNIMSGGNRLSAQNSDRYIDINSNKLPNLQGASADRLIDIKRIISSGNSLQAPNIDRYIEMRVGKGGGLMRPKKANGSTSFNHRTNATIKTQQSNTGNTGSTVNRRRDPLDVLRTDMEKWTKAGKPKGW